MDKARQAYVRMELIDGVCAADIDGMNDDIGNMMICVFKKASAENKDFKRTLRKTARIFLRETGIFAGVVDFWRGHVLTGIVGAAVIYGALRGVGAVLHWMGVC